MQDADEQDHCDDQEDDGGDDGGRAEELVHGGRGWRRGGGAVVVFAGRRCILVVALAHLGIESNRMCAVVVNVFVETGAKFMEEVTIVGDSRRPFDRALVSM